MGLGKGRFAVESCFLRGLFSVTPRIQWVDVGLHTHTEQRITLRMRIKSEHFRIFISSPQAGEWLCPECLHDWWGRPHRGVSGPPAHVQVGGSCPQHVCLHCATGTSGNVPPGGGQLSHAHRSDRFETGASRAQTITLTRAIRMKYWVGVALPDTMKSTPLLVTPAASRRPAPGKPVGPW